MDRNFLDDLRPLFSPPGQKTFTFVDVFAGCGGLSLGFFAAGGQGLFAVEKASDAFLTFRENFLVGPLQWRFDWPKWLPQEATAISNLLKQNREELSELRRGVDVVIGGPPCQGFSFAGKRRPTDPRNELFKSYVDFISILEPQIVVLENVPGMKAIHQKNSDRQRRLSHFEKLINALGRAGYVGGGVILDAATFGVPQRRPRLIAIAVRGDLVELLGGSISQIFTLVEKHRLRMLESLGLRLPVTAQDAIGDLKTKGRRIVPSIDPFSRGKFFQATYRGPRTNYQRLMHQGCASPMDSMRLANHTDAVADRFDHILENCSKGIKLSEKERQRLGMKKHRTVPLAPNAPCPTLTTLPDDLLHFAEPRILTVRECARLQSFPDWFKFRGKYTTGGDRRRTESPRYTQVGNAVPPLLAYAIAGAIAEALHLIRERARKPGTTHTIKKLKQVAFA